MTKSSQSQFVNKESSIFKKMGKVSFFLFSLSFLISPVQADAYFDSFFDESSLLKATEKNRVENVKRLLEKEVDKADLNKAFHKAIKKGNIELVKCFIEHGADLFTKEKWSNMCPRSVAMNADKNSLEIVKVLLESGVNQELALCDASHYGNMEVAKYLLESGTNLDCYDTDGRTPLCFAAGNGKAEMVTYLLDAGANISVTNNKGKTPLSLAVFYGKVSTVKKLIERGADLDDKDDAGVTPLFTAVQKINRTILKVLAEAGARVDIVDSYGMTPLMYAAWKGDLAIAKDLIGYGADIEAKTTKAVTFETKKDPFDFSPKFYRKTTTIPVGSTALDFAKKYNRNSIVKILEKQ